MTRRRLMIGCIAVALFAPCVVGQFVPGHVFVMDNSFCDNYPFDQESVWEVNPFTGEFSLFATIPPELCGATTGLAFSPDGKRLRAASLLWDAILEFDAEGKMTIPLDYTDGISAPEGCNCIAYDWDGNFYVSNTGPPNVLKFPGDGGGPVIIAQHDSNGVHVHFPNALAVDPTGVVYVAKSAEGENILKVDSSGDVSVFDVFDRFNETAVAVAVNDFGDVFVGASAVPHYVYQYDNSTPSSREILATCSQADPELCEAGGLAMSADQRRLLLLSNAPGFRLFALVPETGARELLAERIRPLSRCGIAVVPLRGDLNGLGGTDLVDYGIMADCVLGPTIDVAPDSMTADLDTDGDVDLADLRAFQWAFGGNR